MPCEDGTRFVTAESVEQRSEDRKWNPDHGGVTGIVVTADRQGEVLECCQRITLAGFESTEDVRQGGLGRGGAAVCGNRQSTAQGGTRQSDVRIAMSHSVHQKCKRARI